MTRVPAHTALTTERWGDVDAIVAERWGIDVRKERPTKPNQTREAA